MAVSNVLVTGAARGIGAAAARRLGAGGARVVALDRCGDDPSIAYPLARPEQLDAVVADCPDGSRGVVADVSDRDALGEALAAEDPFDAVVCAAGVLWGGVPVWDTPQEMWRAVFDVNVTGVLNTASVTVPRMLSLPRPRPGRFVAVASAAGTRGLPSLGAYSSSKHAVVGLVRSMAADLADSGITANAVAPGSTDTEILAASAEVYDLEDPAGFASHHPIGRLLDPTEVAEAIAWLCSPASAAVTGAVLPVDGGMTAV